MPSLVRIPAGCHGYAPSSESATTGRRAFHERTHSWDIVPSSHTYPFAARDRFLLPHSFYSSTMWVFFASVFRDCAARARPTRERGCPEVLLICLPSVEACRMRVNLSSRERVVCDGSHEIGLIRRVNERCKRNRWTLRNREKYRRVKCKKSFYNNYLFLRLLHPAAHQARWKIEKHRQECLCHKN